MSVLIGATAHRPQSFRSQRCYPVALALAIGMALLLPSASMANTKIIAPDPGDQVLWQSWVDQSLVPTANVTDTITESVCPGNRYEACTMIFAHPVSTYFPHVDYLFRPPYASDTLDQTRVRLNFLHEMGHVLDWTLPHPERFRAPFLRIMHITGSGPEAVRWSYGHIGTKAVNPNEQFAMAFNYCAMYRTLPTDVTQHVFWGFDYVPTQRQYTQTCQLIKHL